MSTATFIIFLLVSRLPANSCSQLATTTPTPLARLTALETSISVSWRDNDRATFQTDVDTALTKEIPRIMLSITSSVFAATASTLALIPPLFILSAVFTVLSVVADILAQIFFPEEDQFAELYDYLQEAFSKVNAMIESNFHAIKDLQSIVSCNQEFRKLRSHQTVVSAFFSRYMEMLQRAKTDRGQALAAFDTELPQYQSSRIVLELRQMLTDKSLYPKLLTYCAQGDYSRYMKMMVDLHHTFNQAIFLDTAAKLRLFNLTKDVLASDREYWRNQSSAVVNLMTEVGSALIMRSWYNFYVYDVGKSLSSTGMMSGSRAARVLNSALTAKYFYVRTAVIVVPSDHESIAITDAFGQDMKVVSADSFVCYRSRRANRETVIVLCRNVFVYPDEQANLDSAFSTYSRGVLSVSLVDALRNDRWGDIGKVMKNYQVSFFAVKVVAKLKSGTVATAQSSAAVNLAFFQSEGTAFQALVIAKLVANVGSGTGTGTGTGTDTGTGTGTGKKFVPPTKVRSSGPTVTAHWPIVSASALFVLISCATM